MSTAINEISAGGVVYRRHGSKLEIQLIQDRFGKVSLPKGKIEQGETVEQTALREIQEETGINGRVVCPLSMVNYRFTLPSGERISKDVHYYLVEAVSGVTQAQIEEIRGVEWLSADDAWHKQQKFGYENNNKVVIEALRQLGCDLEEI